jgi:hypothetical protein
MSYFDDFPQMMYTFDPNLIEFKQVVDIFVRVKMLDSVINNASVYYTYSVKDSDTPEGIASKYYNDPTRHWIILFTNRIIDPYFEWPMDQAQFNQNMIDNFGSVVNAQATLHHIEKRTHVTTSQYGASSTNTYTSIIGTDVVELDGSAALPSMNTPVIIVGSNNVVTLDSGAEVDTSVLLVAVNAYDDAMNKNEERRNIKLVKVDYVPQIELELKNLLAQ